MSNMSAITFLGIGLGLGGYWLYGQPLTSVSMAFTSPPQTRTIAGNGRFPLCSSAIRRNCVVDGDTFYLAKDKVRIADIDAPETHPPHCAYEADLGDRATSRLSQLLSAGRFELARQGRDEDRYGRKLRVVIRDGRSIGDMLVAEGLARTWTGKRQPWCVGANGSLG